jgi:hypothetical protein
MGKKLNKYKRNRKVDVEAIFQKEDKDIVLIERVYEYIKEGMRSTEILTMLSIEEESLTQTRFNEILKKAYVLAENNVHKDREYIFQLHMERYERMYQKSMIMEDFWGRPLDPKKDWAVIRARYINAAKALKNKEKLLGLHDKSVVVEFNEHKTELIEKEDNRGAIPGIDIELLTFDEQKELLVLIKEARTVPIDGIQRVTIKRTVIEINPETGQRFVQSIETVIDQETKDIEFEDMPLNVVDKFKDVTPKPSEAEPEFGTIIIDSRPKHVETRNIEEVKNQINTDVIEAFKKKLKEKRG